VLYALPSSLPNAGGYDCVPGIDSIVVYDSSIDYSGYPQPDKQQTYNSTSLSWNMPDAGGFIRIYGQSGSSSNPRENDGYICWSPDYTSFSPGYLDSSWTQTGMCQPPYHVAVATSDTSRQTVSVNIRHIHEIYRNGSTRDMVHLNRHVLVSTTVLPMFILFYVKFLSNKAISSLLCYHHCFGSYWTTHLVMLIVELVVIIVSINTFPFGTMRSGIISHLLLSSLSLSLLQIRCSFLTLYARQ
jgi:hypothetical protein